MLLGVLEAVSSFVIVRYTLDTHSSADHPVFVYYIQGAREPLVNCLLHTPTHLHPTLLQNTCRGSWEWLGKCFRKGKAKEKKKEEEPTREWRPLLIKPRDQRAFSTNRKEKWLLHGPGIRQRDVGRGESQNTQLSTQIWKITATTVCL